jgi:transcriptional antiterminator NusG
MTEEDIKTGTAEGEQAQAPEQVQTPEQAANDLTRPTNANMRWYIIHAYSGFERKVKESLESRVQAFGLQDKIGRVVIPMETVTQVRNGKKYNMEQLVYPGYVLVEMELSDEVWHVVKATPRVTGFLGGATHPTPLTDEEVNQIIFRVASSKEKPKLKVKFEKNETVRITEGPFANFNGTVDEVNEDRSTLKVMVTIFGRATPVELEFGQVEKVAA